MIKLYSNIHKLSALVFFLPLSVAPCLSVAHEPVTVDFYPTDGIVFNPNVEGESVTVRVACEDGTYFEQDFSGTQTTMISQNALPLTDQQCKYEVRIHPVVDRAAVKAAQKAGDDKSRKELWEAARRQTQVQNGSFQIIGGQILPPVDRVQENIGEPALHNHSH